MQRVTNCMLMADGKALMLQKPRRNWWVAPGGKMESGESIHDSVMREFYEETNLKIERPDLKGIFTMVNMKDDQIVHEWMLFSFRAYAFKGEAYQENEEGILKWHPLNDILALPMAEGDRKILDHMMNGQGILIGTFKYTEDFILLDYKLERNGE
ncbi:8-oxo-dGTP diphosphatase [Bacillus sp. FJAT-27986]|uniref:8-oxo-dGTP diphosphatase n=1 Tax=Bacillus sp. FJAT-27986 TaxID=1743146 RepID=UPI00080ACC7F|nr:8-oxo-dGTP diphosphatase [Bacillus sp. FJAT-27986]OCA84728.1 NUDIX hydrolase [Bacillus sp. FJAT-27986]